jgi:hypothetical protein
MRTIRSTADFQPSPLRNVSLARSIGRLDRTDFYRGSQIVLHPVMDSLDMKFRGPQMVERGSLFVYLKATTNPNIPMPLHWLSFADPELPTGPQFLGVSIVEAPDFLSAMAATQFLGHQSWWGMPRSRNTQRYATATDAKQLNAIMSKTH